MSIITQDQLKVMLDGIDPKLDKQKVLESMLNKGAIIQGINEPKSEPTALDNAAGYVKSAAGGFAHGVAGATLTGIDYLGKKIVDTYGTDQMKANVANSPSLHDQFKQQFGGVENPNTFGAGELAGEVAQLAAPVTKIGNTVSGVAKTLGAGKNVATLAKAGAEGLAFTAGQNLTEGKPESLKDYIVNSGINMALPASSMVLKSASEKLAPRLINSLIKPLGKDFSYGKNPGKTVADLGITGNTMDELISNIGKAKNDAGATIGSVISQAKSQLKLDSVNTLKYIDEAISIANKTPRTNATLLQRLDSIKQDIVDNLNVSGNNLQAAQDVKKVIGDLTKWTGAASDDKVVNKALQKTYTSVRDQMDSSLKTELSPEQFAQYKKAADDYGNLMSAENAAINRDAILNRQDLISFGAKNAGFLAGLSSVVTGGASLETLLATAGGVLFDKAMATPAFKTRAAALLAKMPKEDVKTFFDRVPQAKIIFSSKENAPK